MTENFQPFAHLTAPNSVLYRQVMSTFVDAKRRFTVHLRPEDVHETLADIEPNSVADALTRLVEWGNLHADPDTSRVTTVEDFHRARFLYQLTERGEAVELALAAYDEALGRRGALQAVALSDIATQLQALLELARQSAPDPAKVHLLLRALVDRFTDLASNAQAFMGSLQRTIDLHDADADAFRAYKDRLIDYLERFIRDLVGTGGKIATLIDEIELLGVGPLLDITAWREAEDAAPGQAEGSDDPGGLNSNAFDRCGKTAGRACAAGSSANSTTPARRSCSVRKPGRRFRSSCKSSPRSTSAGPAGPIDPRTSAAWPDGSPKHRTTTRRTGSGARHSDCPRPGT